MTIKRLFNTEYDGKPIGLYNISNENGYKLAVTNYGCRMVSLWVRDNKNNIIDVLCGYDTIEEYLRDDSNQGALVGRVANRIANAEFTLKGQKYILTKNIAGIHHLHGGIKGFSRVAWTVEEHTASSITLSYLSIDGEQGYPGNVTTKVHFEWTKDNRLKTLITATTDQTTVVNPTLHPYFNLMGEGTQNLEGQYIRINSSQILEFGEGAVATGKKLSVIDTPFDFRNAKCIDFPAVMETKWGQEGEGIDHFYVLDVWNGKLKEVATAKAPNGVNLIIYSDRPGVQFYTSNFLSTKGKENKPYIKYSAFCLETQVHPNSPRIPHFPSIILEPGEVYENTTEFQF